MSAPMSAPYGYAPSSFTGQSRMPLSQGFISDPNVRVEEARPITKAYDPNGGVEGYGAAGKTYFADNFATSLFLITFALFATPMRLTISACSTLQVQYWISSTISYWVCLLPIFYLGIFIWHTISRKPSKFMTIFSLIGSCIFFLIVCDMVLLNSVYLGEAFAVSDCDSYPGKRMMQMEWDQARTFYASCVGAKANETKMEYAAIAATDRIQDCPDYKKAVKAHPAWKYLGAMEEDNGCSGWCKREQTLWTRRATKDSCSTVSSQIFREVVLARMKQVVLYTVGTLACIAALFFMAGPVLRSQGIDW